MLVDLILPNKKKERKFSTEMDKTETIASRIIQYLGDQDVTQEEFAEDSKHGKPFDKGRLGKADRNGATLGSDVVEKFLRRFPDVNPYWLILGEGEKRPKRESVYNEPVKVLPLDAWDQIKRSTDLFTITIESNIVDKQNLNNIINYFMGSAINPHKAQ